MIAAYLRQMFSHKISSGDMASILPTSSNVSAGKYFENNPCFTALVFCNLPMQTLDTFRFVSVVFFEPFSRSHLYLEAHCLTVLAGILYCSKIALKVEPFSYKI